MKHFTLLIKNASHYFLISVFLSSINAIMKNMIPRLQFSKVSLLNEETSFHQFVHNNFKERGFILLVMIMALVSGNLQAQVSNYTFTQASGGYSAITGGTILGTTANDEEAFNNSTTGATSTVSNTGFPIGFTFYYNGIAYDKFAVNTNGFIVLGTGTFSIYATTGGALTPLSSTNTGLVSAISNATHDLQGQTLTSSGTRTNGSNSITGVTANRAAPGMTITGSGIPANTQVTAVSGTTITISNNATSGGSSTYTFGSTIQYKNVGATLIVQWAGYREFNATGDFFNYQIMLSQTTNTVAFLYGTNVASPSSNGTAYSTQVGIRGASNADYDNRVVSTSGNWNASTAGTSNTDVCRLRNTIVPAFGQTYIWTPPVPAITSFSPANPCVGSTITITGTNLSGTTSVTIGGTAATILTNTATQITATVGSGTTGTITVVNYGGSGTSASTCTIVQQPTAVAGGSQAICQTGTATVSGATSSNGTIAWTENGAGSITSGAATLTPVYTPAAGDAGAAVTLTMTVSNSPCAAATASYIVNVNGLPTAAAGGSQTICQTGTATVSGATSSNGTIAWTENGAGSITSGAATLTPVYTPAAGDAGNTVTLTMTVTSANACSPASATASYTVIVKATPTAAAGGSQTICQTGTATVSGATSSNGTIAWTENGAGSITSGAATLTPVYTPAAGDVGNAVTLTMTVGNSPCTAATATYIVNVNGLPTALAGGSQTICQTGTATVSGATSSNGTIAWTENGAGSITSGASTLTPVYTAAPGDAGNTVTLTMTVTSNNACAPTIATAIYSVVVKATPTALAGGSQSICRTSTATVSGAASSNGTILWTENGVGSITSGSTTLTPVYTAAAGDAGNIVTLTMTVSNSPCTAATAIYTVNVAPTPTASAGGSQTICQTSAATVSGASSSNGTILWTDNGAGSITAGATTLTPTYTPAAGDAGNTVTLTMTVTSNNACAPATATATYSVIVKGTPTATAGGSQTICPGGAAIVSGASSTNGTILWTENGAGTITSGSTTLTPTYTSAAGDAGNTVTLTMTVTNSPCAAATATYTVIVSPAAPAAVGAITGTATVCEGATSLNYTVAAVTNATNYTWTVPTGWSITGGQGSNSLFVTAGSGGQNGDITVVASNSCGSNNPVTSINISAVNSTNNTGFTTSTTKSPGNITVASSSAGTVRYGYLKFPLTSIPAGAIISSSSLSLTNNASGNLSSQINNVRALGNNDPVTASAATLFSAIPAGTSYDADTWTNTGTIVLALNAAANTDIQNRITTPAYIAMGLERGAGTSIYNFFGSAGPTAPVLAVNYASPRSLAVIVNSLPEITVEPTTPAATCSGSGTQIISITATGTGLLYSWRKAGVPVSNGAGISGQGTATLTLTNPLTANAGSYDVVVSGTCTPSVTSNAVTVTVNTPPSISVNPTTPAATCSGNGVQTISVTATGTGLTYSWRKAGVALANDAVISGQGTPFLTLTNPTAANAGNYDVVVGGTCSPSVTSGAVTVTINALPSISVQPVAPAATCSGSGTQTISVTAAGAGLSYSWRKDGVPLSNNGVISGQGTNTLSLTNATAANAGSYDVVISGTCTPGVTSNAVAVSVNPTTTISADAAPVSQTVYINDPSPNNLTITVAGTAPLTYQWFSNVSNSNAGGTTVGAANGGQTNTFTPPTNVLGIKYYYAVATGTCGTVTSSAVAVTITNTNTWKQSNPTNDWNIASNWAGGSVPTGVNDAAIPAGNTPYPILSTSSAINNLIIDPGATVGIGTNTFTINGAVTGTGTLSGSATSAVVTNASTGLLFTPGANTLKDLTVSAGTTTLSNALNITGGTAANTYGTVTVAPGATLASGGNLTIKSNQFGTARVAAGDVAGNYITGDVTVERYIPQNSKRAWRLLSVPTKGTKTIKQTWQENQAAGANGTPGFGTIITSNIATAAPLQAAGFDAYSQLPSMQSYNSATQGWVYVTSTNAAPIQSNKGYFLYIRGDRSVTTSSSTDAASATTLRTTGTLYQGNSNPAVSIAAGKFEPVGNTFASAIDFTSLSKTGGISNTFYVWDSKLLSGTTLGAYQTFNGSIGYTPATPGGSYPAGVPNTSIESGEAFMLGATGTAGTVTLVEASKTTGNQFTPFRPAALPAQFKTSLLKVNGSTSAFADNNIVAFDNAFSNAVDGDDAPKFMHAGENVSIIRNGIELIIEARQPVTSNDTLFFNMSGMVPAQQYRFEFSNSNLPLTGLTAFVEDKFLNTATPIDLTAAIHQHNFSVDATAASFAKDRFRIVFKQSIAGPLPVSFISINANHLNTGGIQVAWTVAGERSILQYEIESSADGSRFNAAATVAATGRLSYNWIDAAANNGITYYRIKSTGAAGDIKYSAVVKVSLNVKPSISISPNPVEGSVANLQFKNQLKGRYNIRLLTNTGQSILAATIEHAGGNSVQTLNLPGTIARGNYQLEITCPDKTKKVQTLFINTVK